MLRQRVLSINILVIILKHVIANEEPESHNFDAAYYDDTDDFQYGDYGDDTDFECDFYHKLEEDHACHHDKFSLVDELTKKFNKNIKQCCGFHGYTYHNYCEVSYVTRSTKSQSYQF